ncbi:MAG: UDP-N-acetylmuramate--L-alanine ligase [Candidatus Babeliales bacterium]
MYNSKAHIHFVGIGGIGMSGIAQILKNQGYEISGCDADMDQQSIKDLKSGGCIIFEGNNSPACHECNPDILVYSSAIRSHNPEIIAAQARGIPTIARALMLAELMRTKFSIAISGSHGKTTTTSLVSHILMEAQLDPTVIVGGHLKNIDANARLGNGEFLVAETDESDRSVQNLHPTLAVVTNIDLEHLETYKDLDDIKDTFKRFLNNIPFYGKAFVCIDDANVRSIIPTLPHIKMVKYGLDESADIFATNIKLEIDHSTFTVHGKDGTTLGRMTSHMLGRHNILNTLAATAVALDLGISFEIIATAINNFKGIERRFCYKGTYQGAEIFDDYGHHPIEIYNTLLVARKRAKKKLIVVFQPHRYTRTDKLWNDFVRILTNAEIDHLIITDIFPASEAPILNVTSQNLVNAMLEQHPAFPISYVPYEADFVQIKQTLAPLAHENDLVLLLGAGKVNKLVNYLK